MTRRMRFAVRLWPWVLAMLVLAPALAPGYVLSYDMVFVPDLALRSDFLGLGTSLPRAVPSDAVVAVLDEVVPGMLLQKVVLVGALVLAGTGARRLVPADSGVAQLAATSLYVWNPYVAERLVMGHWPTLLAYAALPWVVDAARRWRTGEWVFPSLVLWLALGSIGASGGVMTAIAAVAVGAGGRSRAGRRRTLALVLAVMAVNAPWLVAGLLHSGGATSDPTGVELFAAGPEGSLPAPLAWVGLGGVWNVEAVPGSRLGVLGWVSLVAVVAVCAAGARLWWQTVGHRTASGLLVCAVMGLTLAALGGVLPDTMTWIVLHVPGGGLLRDGSRYLGLLAVTEASLFGFGAVVLSATFRDALARRSLALGAVLVPLALLPDLALGVSGRLEPVSYPSAYDTARSVLVAAEDEAGDLLVLPLTSYRAPDWNGGRKVLDPLGRYMTPNYVASDVLSVSGKVLKGEDPRAADALAAIRASHSQDRASALGRLGIRYVLTDTTAPGAKAGGDYAADLPGRRLFEGGGLELISLQVPVRIASPSTAAIVALAAAWAAWAISLAAALVTIVLSLVHGPSTRRHGPKAPTPREGG